MHLLLFIQVYIQSKNFSHLHDFGNAIRMARIQSAGNCCSLQSDTTNSIYVVNVIRPSAFINSFLPAGLRVAQPCRYCFYSLAQKWVFRPSGATHCPDNAPVPTFTFIWAKMWEYSPQNCQNFEFWPENCTSGATRLQYYYEILSVCRRLQVAFKFLVWSL